MSGNIHLFCKYLANKTYVSVSVMSTRETVWHRIQSLSPRSSQCVENKLGETEKEEGSSLSQENLRGDISVFKSSKVHHIEEGSWAGVPFIACATLFLSAHIVSFFFVFRWYKMLNTFILLKKENFFWKVHNDKAPFHFCHSLSCPTLRFSNWLLVYLPVFLYTDTNKCKYILFRLFLHES